MAMDHVGGFPEGYISANVTEAGKILLLCMTIFFMLLFLIFIVHVYFRWIVNRSRLSRDHPRSLNFVYSGQTQGTLPRAVTALCNSGLEQSVIQSLPTFVYAVNPQKDGLECSICLSAFEEKDRGRLLPECNHGFHVDCIDMWFQSHSTCPICRALVKDWHFPGNYNANDGACVVSDLPPIDSDSNLNSASVPAESNSFRETNFVIPIPESVNGQSTKQAESLECSERQLGKCQSASPLRKLKRILSREGGRSSSSMAYDGSDIETGREDDRSFPR